MRAIIGKWKMLVALLLILGLVGTVSAADGVFIRYRGSPTVTDADLIIYNAGNSTWKPVSVSGDVNITNAGVTTVQADAVALAADTTGNYVATVAEGEGINVVGSGGENAAVTVSGELATYSNLGLALFYEVDFVIVGGNVTLADTVVSAMSTDSGAVVPSGNSVTITGGAGISTSAAGGDTLTVSGTDAGTVNKGIAVFDPNDFTVAAGNVSLATRAYEYYLTAGGATVGTGAGNATQGLDVDGNYPKYTLAFDPDTDEHAYWNNFQLSNLYNSGNFTVQIDWYAAAIAGDVVWNVRLAGIADSESVDTVSWGSTYSTTTTTDGVANDRNTTTISGVAHGLVANDYVVVDIWRDANVGGDTMAGDAEMVGGIIQFTGSR